MRPKLVEGPANRASLASMAVHILVRDYAEALPVLRDEGVDLKALGARPLAEAGPGVVDAVARALAWRPRA